MATTLARKFVLQVTADTTLASGWLTVNGLSTFDPEITPNLVDTTAYDTTGWTTQEATLQAWTLNTTFFRRLVAGVYDPGQELIRAALGQFGTAARIGVRWYDRNGGPEAYSGVAIISWKRGSSTAKDVESVSVTFTGTDIPLNLNITNPYSVAAVPIITAVTPSGQGATQSVAIYGQNFTGVVATTGVKFGGTNATSFTFQNDGLITAVLPAGSAGTITVLVTNATGPSTAANNYIRAT